MSVGDRGNAADSRRAPRQRLEPERRRRQLVDATVIVVSRRGYQKASFAEIAREAGVSKGLLWHYFVDGDDLMAQTARLTLVRLRETVAHDIDLTVDVPQIIRSAIRRVVALRETHRAELRAMREIVQNLREADGTPRLGLNEYEETYTLQETLFQRGQDEGSLRDFDVRCMAVTYQGAVDIMLSYLDSHPDADANQFADTVAELFLTGITAPEHVSGERREHLLEEPDGS